MQLGRILEEFYTRDGQKVIFRTPKYEDLVDILELINSLIDEKTGIARSIKVTKGEAIEWLNKMLAKLDNEEVFFLAAEVNNKVISLSDINIVSRNENYNGIIGIAVKKGFRGLGIGTEIVKILVEQAKLLELKNLELRIFATNEREIFFYKKRGFIQTDIIPKRPEYDIYVDELVLTKSID